MPQYKSIFSKSGILSKQDLCELLGLNIAREPLTFTDSEITRAFKKRALRFHPDKQKRYAIQLPESTCNLLINDCTRARDHLLNGDEYVLGEETPIESSELRNFLHSMRQYNPEEIANRINLLSFLIPFNSFFLGLLFSQFTPEQQLLFQYINHFPKDRAFLNYIDPTVITPLLKALRNICERIAINQEEIATLIPEEFKFIHDIFNDPALPDLLQNYQALLSDSNIEALQKIATTTYQFLVNIPSYSLIMWTFLISMAWPVDQLNKIIAAYRDIVLVVWQQKNLSTALSIYLSLGLISGIVLPLNFIFSFINMRLLLNALKLIVLNIIQIPMSMIHFFRSEISITAIVKLGVDLLSCVLNLAIRLPITLSIDLIDNVLYWFGEQRLLECKLDELNEFLENSYASYFPKSSQNREIVALNEEPYEKTVFPTQAQSASSSDFLTKDDQWLANLLAQTSPAEEPIVSGSSHSLFNNPSLAGKNNDVTIAPQLTT